MSRRNLTVISRDRRRWTAAVDYGGQPGDAGLGLDGVSKISTW